MELESLLPNKHTYGGIKMCMRRRRYKLLSTDDVTISQRKMKIKMLRRSQNKYWRIRTIPKLRWVIRSSPLKVLTKLKKSYMNFMLKLAGNIGGSLNTKKFFGEKQIPKAGQVFSKLYSGDAFEARLIYEISKTLVASHELYPM